MGREGCQSSFKLIFTCLCASFSFPLNDKKHAAKNCHPYVVYFRSLFVCLEVFAVIADFGLDRPRATSTDSPETVTAWFAVSAGLAKVIAIRERYNLRFESTFTNVLNHTNFAPPVTNISSPTSFGVLTSAQTAENAGNRTGQLALRLEF
jgi:hypothetical protein